MIQKYQTDTFWRLAFHIIGNAIRWSSWIKKVRSRDPELHHSAMISHFFGSCIWRRLCSFCRSSQEELPICLQWIAHQLPNMLRMQVQLPIIGHLLAAPMKWASAVPLVKWAGNWDDSIPHWHPRYYIPLAYRYACSIPVRIPTKGQASTGYLGCRYRTRESDAIKMHCWYYVSIMYMSRT